MGGKIRLSSRRGAGALLALLLAACVSPASFAEGLLQKIRDDVRGVSSGSSSSGSSSKSALGDDPGDYNRFYFAPFPYDHVPGYMMGDPCESWYEDPDCAAAPPTIEAWPTRPRTWGARLRMEYAEEFHDVTRIWF